MKHSEVDTHGTERFYENGKLVKVVLSDEEWNKVKTKTIATNKEEFEQCWLEDEILIRSLRKKRGLLK